jgi:Kef-type K+ transport system membrane component KefB
MNQWGIAALWTALALAAGLISVRTAISVSLVEIALGVIGGNYLGLHATEWTNFLAGFGAILLTFLAGAEIEPDALRRHLKSSLTIGFISFLFPFAGALLFAHFLAGWNVRAAQIAGIALSTTSVAVVYAVLLETGLNRTELGRLILSACFITDLGTVLALGVFFANYNLWLVLFAAVTLAVLICLPRVARWFFRSYGGQVSEMETRFLFVLLFGLGSLAVKANSEAVLPAYLAGLVVASLFAQHRDIVRRMRTTVFALLTPFYFLKAGMLVSVPAVWAGAGLIVLLLAVKLVTKTVGVFPLTRAFRLLPTEGIYTTLLMSTGLTFATISALFGYQRGFITQSQYTILVTVVIGSAVAPTLIAQRFFKPSPDQGQDRQQESPVSSQLAEVIDHV